MTSVADAVQAMKAKFNPAAAAGLDLVFGFRIDDTKNFSLIVKDSTCELKEGENPDAQVTLVMDGETLEGIVDGSTDGNGLLAKGDRGCHAGSPLQPTSGACLQAHGCRDLPEFAPWTACVRLRR